MGIKEPRPTRPIFPDGYGFGPNTPHSPPTWRSIVARIRESRNYWVCTTSPTGIPHAMPVWGVWVKGRLCFVTKRGSKKARNLYSRDQVVVHLESGDDLVVIEGKATELRDTKELSEVARIYTGKYEGDKILPDLEAVFELHPEQIFTWLERDFHATATKWVFEDEESQYQRSCQAEDGRH